MGVFTVQSIVLGGKGLPYLAEPVFDYVSCGRYDTSNVPTEIIPDTSLRFVIEKVIHIPDVNSSLLLLYGVVSN